MIDTRGAQKWIRFLNHLLKVDAAAVNRLFSTRVRCNKKMMTHPTVQVGLTKGRSRVGFIGILNGFHGADDEGWGGIAAFIDDDSGKIIKFGKTPKRR